MEKAVLAGDAAGYMERVATGDAIFLQEQKMWAKDLVTRKPAEFELSIEPTAEPKEKAEDEAPFAEEFGDDVSRFTLKTKWVLTAGGRARSVTVPVLFSKKGEAWLYEGEVWSVLQKPAVEGSGAGPIRVLYPHGLEKNARAAAEILPVVRDHVDKLFAIKNTDEQVVKLYTSMTHLQLSIYPSYVDGLGGWNEPGESIKILVGRNDGGGGLKSLLSHEYGHCATFFLGPKANEAPWWVLEGIADFSASSWRDKPAAAATRRAIGWAMHDKLAKWEDLTDFRTVPSKLHGYVYTQGEHMMHYFTERFGADKRNLWLRAMATGKTLDEATTEATGNGFAQLDREWRAALAELAKAEKEAEEKAPK